MLLSMVSRLLDKSANFGFVFRFVSFYAAAYIYTPGSDAGNGLGNVAWMQTSCQKNTLLPGYLVCQAPIVRCSATSPAWCGCVQEQAPACGTIRLEQRWI